MTNNANPDTPKIDHEGARVISRRDAQEVPPDAERDHMLVGWAECFYLNAMRIATAVVLVQEGSLNKAASVLWWAGFAVPAGYFPVDHEGHLYGLRDERALELWIEAEAEYIERTIETRGFHLAASGHLLDRHEEGA